MLVLTLTPSNKIVLLLPDGRSIEVYANKQEYASIAFNAPKDIKIIREKRNE